MYLRWLISVLCIKSNNQGGLFYQDKKKCQDPIHVQVIRFHNSIPLFSRKRKEKKSQTSFHKISIQLASPLLFFNGFKLHYYFLFIYLHMIHNSIHFFSCQLTKTINITFCKISTIKIRKRNNFHRRKYLGILS